jgi:beta-glucanase (GH16 family)
VYEYGETFMDEDLSADFHTYGLAWTPDQMTLYIDRLAFWTVSRQTIRSEFWPGNKPYFLILNNAIGPREGGFGGPWGDWTTAQMHIDYVRVYKLDGYGQVFK